MRTRLRTLRVGERTYTLRATIGQVAGEGVDTHRSRERGLDPGVLGGTFRLAERHGVELPGFLLTDRLRDPGAPDPSARVARANERQARNASS